MHCTLKPTYLVVLVLSHILEKSFCKYQFSAHTNITNNEYTHTKRNNTQFGSFHKKEKKDKPRFSKC